jgi:hypothetical protein
MVFKEAGTAKAGTEFKEVLLEFICLDVIFIQHRHHGLPKTIALGDKRPKPAPPQGREKDRWRC